MLPIEVRTSFGDVANTTLVEFCGRDATDGDVPPTLTLPATIPAALRGGVPAILTILVTPTCCVPLALVVMLFGMTY